MTAKPPTDDPPPPSLFGDLASRLDSGGGPPLHHPSQPHSVVRFAHEWSTVDALKEMVMGARPDPFVVCLVAAEEEPKGASKASGKFRSRRARRARRSRRSRRSRPPRR